MRSDKPLIRLGDILENVDRIRRYTEGYDFERFAGDSRCQDAVERCLLRISEAARKLSGFLEEVRRSSPGRTCGRWETCCGMTTPSTP